MTHAASRRVLLFNAAAPSRFTPADVPQAEADALIALYNAANGPSWIDNTGWLEDTTVGNWFGITVAGGHVTSIDLRMNNLQPSIASVDLSAFADYVTFIRFAHNPGDVPNKLDGDLSQFSGFTALATLDVGPSDFTGSFDDLSGCTALHSLDLQSCSNIGGNLTDLANLANYTRLDLAGTTVDNPFSMSDLATITDPTAYIDLRLDTYNILTGDLSDLPAWANLDSFLLHRQNLITVNQATNFGSWTNIQSIRLEEQSFSQAEQDQILSDIYAARASFAFATPILDLSEQGGAEPSGTYQYAASPSTGKEYIYALANDDDSEGFNTWTISYDEGGVDTTVP